jgi:ankyrin repeat protein
METEEIEALVDLIKTKDINVITRDIKTNPKLIGGLLTFRDSVGNSAFTHAVASGHIDTVKLLLKMGADATSSNNYGWTPLSVAASRGSTNIVKFLLENTSQSQNEATVFGLTALICSVYTGRYKICQYLVGSGVSINSAGAGISIIS